MKMSKKLENELRNIESKLNDVVNYIKNPEILICIKSNGSVSSEYKNEKTGNFIYSVDKEIGSHITQLYKALGDVKRLIKKEK